MTIKSPVLCIGDVIGIIAPSWSGPATYPWCVKRGVRFLESLGYKVVVARHVYGKRGYVSGTPEERVEDIHELFGDSTVRGIIAAIGGEHSCHLLPYMDWDLVKRHPKIFMGFSDITVLNLAIYSQTGLVTFNGPMIMTDFGEYPEPLPYTLEYVWRGLCRAEPIGEVEPASKWTDEFLHWTAHQGSTESRTLYPSPGWTWLKGGEADGRLIGGCLESLQHLRGTSYWPNLQDAILFIETSESKPKPRWVDAVLQDYDNMGVFKQITGLLVGLCSGYTEDQKEALRSILIERTRGYGFPIVTDMDFGHTSPQFTLPIGCQARIDSSEKRLIVTESAVVPRTD